jgi:hypothetical protein
MGEIGLLFAYDEKEQCHEGNHAQPGKKQH